MLWPIKNTNTRYGSIAILLHWIMAILIIGMLCVGLYMKSLPDSPEKFMIYGWHKTTGVVVFILALLRVIWALSNIRPHLNVSKLQVFVARSVHNLLYLLMIAMPLSGWFMSSAADHPPSFFGLFNLPNLIAPDPDLSKVLSQVHGYIGFTLIGLIVLHTLAALKHHFIDKDNVLHRMISLKE